MDRDLRTKEGAPLTAFDLRRFLRELLIVPENKLVDELLSEMRAHRSGMAMVVDEFGSILGLLTMEDIIEQMVGEIHDEFDTVEVPQVVGTGSDRALVFDGGIALRDLETQYGVKLPEDAAYNTLGGFVFAHLGFIPRGGESFEQSGYRVTVLEMDRRRVARVKLQPLTADSSFDSTPRANADAGHLDRQASNSLPDGSPVAARRPDASRTELPARKFDEPMR